MAVAWSSAVAGFQVPVMPLLEVAGKAGAPDPAQMVMDVPKSNVGVKFGLTVKLNVVLTAHCPAAGVNV